MNARSIAAIVVVLTGVMLSLVPANAQTASNFVALENNFVRVVVNTGEQETGRFSIRTTGGDPARAASQNKPLIYGGDKPWTSYTTVNIDGKLFAFGNATERRAGRDAAYGDMISAPKLDDGKIITKCQYSDIVVTQTLTLVRGISTRMYDTVGIAYQIENTGEREHTVGLRVMLDTKCGENDGAPLRLAAQFQALTKAITLKDGVPDYWQAFDDLSHPTVISQGTLKGGGTTPPDAVTFADWGTLADELWSPQLDPEQGFIRKEEEDADTAVAMFWQPLTVEGGKSRQITTFYGMGDITGGGGELSLGLSAPAETTFMHERTEKFTIMGYLQNTGKFDAHDVKVNVALPKGLVLLSGSKLQERYPVIKRGETLQFSWTVIADGTSGGMELPLVFNATPAAGDVEPNSVARKIDVFVPTPTLAVTPGKQQAPLVTNGLPSIVLVQVTMTPVDNLFGITLAVKYDPKVIKPFDVSRGRAFVENGGLLPGWAYDLSEDGIIRIVADRSTAKPLTQAETNIATIKFRAIDPGVTAVTLTEAAFTNGDLLEQKLILSHGEVTITPK